MTIKRAMFGLTIALAVMVGQASAVEMFTHFNDGQSLGFEPRNAVKPYYPGYLLPNGCRQPVQPAPGAHPWTWRGWQPTRGR